MRNSSLSLILSLHLHTSNIVIIIFLTKKMLLLVVLLVLVFPTASNSMFSSSPCQVAEESREGTRICNVSSGLTSGSSALRSSRRYQLVDHGNLFALRQGEVDQELVVSGNIDREKLCPNSGENLPRSETSSPGPVCQLQVTLASVPEGSSTGPYQQSSRTFDILIVEVKDINDHTPSFVTSFMKVDVRENQPRQIISRLSRAVDLDTGENGRITYILQLISSEPRLSTSAQIPFVVDDVSGEETLILKALRTFDREKEENFVLHLLGQDHGSPTARTGTLTLSINVQEENEFSPEFTESAYTIQVSENLAESAPILLVKATDKDHASHVTFQIDAHATLETRRHFRLTENGELSVLERLDYERARLYKVPIVATDNGVPPKSSSATITIHVLDENDCRPVIEVYPLADQEQGLHRGELTVEENVEGEKLIAMIKVFDHDSSKNGMVNCELQNVENSPQWNNFFLSPPDSSSDSYQPGGTTEKRLSLRARGVFDREVKAKYTLVLVCEDNGTPRLKAQKSLTVKIRDQNDNGPTFEQHTAHTSLSENSQAGTFLYRAQAVDRDEGSNAIIVYSVQPESLFKIDAVSGEVVSRVPYDREENATLTFTVTALDRADPRMNDSVKVIVKILDENDCVPRFLKNYTFHVKENLASAPLGRVEAVDCDVDRNAQLTYRWHPDTSLVAISGWKLSSNGVLQLVHHQPLDRETKSVYEWVVIAQDGGSPSLTGSATVTVLVDDEDDNPPIFIFPNLNNDSVKIPTNLPVGSRITQVLAQDADEGENARIVFELNNYSLASHFIINNETGELFLAKALNPGGTHTPIRLFLTIANVLHPLRKSYRTLKIYFDSSNNDASLPDSSGGSKDGGTSRGGNTGNNGNTGAVTTTWMPSKEVLLGFGIGLTLVLICCFFVLALFLWKTLCISEEASSAQMYQQKSGGVNGPHFHFQHPSGLSRDPASGTQSNGAFSVFQVCCPLRRDVESSTDKSPDTLTGFPPAEENDPILLLSLRNRCHLQQMLPEDRRHGENLPERQAGEAAQLLMGNGTAADQPGSYPDQGCYTMAHGLTNCNSKEEPPYDGCWTLGAQYKHGGGGTGSYHPQHANSYYSHLMTHSAGKNRLPMANDHSSYGSPGGGLAYTKLSLVNSPGGSRQTTPLHHKQLQTGHMSSASSGNLLDLNPCTRSASTAETPHQMMEKRPSCSSDTGANNLYSEYGHKKTSSPNCNLTLHSPRHQTVPNTAAAGVYVTSTFV